MFICTLLYPHLPSWEAEHGFSRDARSDLELAYSAIKAGNGYAPGFLDAANQVERWVKRRISAHQRMHVYYVMALTHAAVEQPYRALTWLDKALAMADRLHEYGDQAELLSLRASLHRATLRFAEAVDDLKTNWLLLDKQQDYYGIDDPSARLRVLAQLATFEFFLTHYDSADDILRQARRFISHSAASSSLDAATLEWTQAKLYHLRGLPEMALRHILPAAAVYKREAPAISHERIEIDVAEFALTWAQTLPEGSDRAAIARLALPHLRTAERIVRDRKDEPGNTLTQLARVRYDRLTRRTLDRLAVIEMVIERGHELHDVAAVAQGLTALGEEFVFQNELEAALRSFQQVEDTLAGSQVPVLAVPAYRALHISHEVAPQH